MSEPSKSAVWVELLKYPVTILSLLLALVGAKSMLGLQFGAVTELGPGGFKFAQEAKGEIADIASKLNGALAEIEALKKAAPAAQAASAQTQKELFAASQTVSDQTAQLADVAREIAPNGPVTRKGYIWIGDYKTAWGKVMLGNTSQGDAPVTTRPEDLPLGSSYTALGNLVVRDGLPSNDAEYFRARSSLGVVPKGTSLRLVSTPVAINREYAVQYWAQIEWK